MPRWKPEQFWKDQDVYIIGGGPSLEGFDWDILKDKNTIGCNSAFIHGHEICKICIFGDIKWWVNSREELKKFKGTVVTTAPKLEMADVPWLKTMKRVHSGLALDGLGWNGNTGASAINLALLLGAKRIFLLGFDMKLGSYGQANWHDRRFEPAREEVYIRFLRGYIDVARDLQSLFPDAEVFNVTDDSDLNVFPKVSLEDHFGYLNKPVVFDDDFDPEQIFDDEEEDF